MRILALIISGYQAFRLVFDLKKYIFNWNILTVSNLILLMMTGTIVCIWFSELLTEKGLGNG
jgi:preprotein translocase subunit SecY